MLLLVFSFSAFSINANAESVDIGEYQVTHSSTVQSVYNDLNVKPNDGIEQKREKPFTMSTNILKNVSWYNTHTVKKTNNTILVEGGKDIKVKIENIYHSLYLAPYDTSDNILTGRYITDIGTYYCYFTHTDGTISMAEDENVSVTISGKNMSVTITGTTKKDVSSVTFTTGYSFSNINSYLTGYTKWQVTTYTGEFNGDNTYQVSVTQSSEEAGLLSGLIEWVKQIFDRIGEGFSNVVNSIVELPGKIWDKIKAGLEELFVPGDQYITIWKENINQMLYVKFGAVYEVIGIMQDSWVDVLTSDVTNTISLPETTIDLPENETFSFGGYDVLIVPEGFEWLATIIKTLLSCICTVMLVNGLRERYDEVMGVEE